MLCLDQTIISEMLITAVLVTIRLYEMCVVTTFLFSSSSLGRLCKEKRGRDDAWEQDEFVSFKSIENDRSVCVCICLYYIIILCRVT